MKTKNEQKWIGDLFVSFNMNNHVFIGKHYFVPFVLNRVVKIKILEIRIIYFHYFIDKPFLVKNIPILLYSFASFRDGF